MRNIFKFSAVVFTVASILSAGSVCFCNGSSQDLKTFRGQVMEIDWVGSLLTCQGADEMTFYVPSGMKIRYGTDTVSFEDLEQEDYVLIKYIDNPLNKITLKMGFSIYPTPTECDKIKGIRYTRKKHGEKNKIDRNNAAVCALY